MYSSNGLAVFKDETGKESVPSLYSTLSPEGDQGIFAEKIKDLYRAACAILGQVKIQVGLGDDFNPEKPGKIFQSPLRKPKNKATNEELTGRNPGITFKTFRRVGGDKTVFQFPKMTSTNKEIRSSRIRKSRGKL